MPMWVILQDNNKNVMSHWLRGNYLFLDSRFDVMEGQRGLRTGGDLGTGPSRGFVRGRSRQRVVVVVVGQADGRAAPRGFVVMRRRAQLPASLFQQRLLRLVARVRPIAAGQQRYRVVVFDVADVGFIALSRRSVQHLVRLEETSSWKFLRG